MRLKKWGKQLNIMLMAIFVAIGCSACNGGDPVIEQTPAPTSAPIQSESPIPDVEEDPLAELKGIRAGETYDNRYFGFVITLNSDWEIESPEYDVLATGEQNETNVTSALSDFIATSKTTGASLDVTLCWSDAVASFDSQHLNEYKQLISRSIEDSGVYKNISVKTCYIKIETVSIPALQVSGSIEKGGRLVSVYTTQLLIAENSGICILSVSSCETDLTESVIQEIFSFGKGSD